MDANRQDALECIRRAKQYAATGDRVRFDKFIRKAKRLDPSIDLAGVSFFNEEEPPQRNRSLSRSREETPSTTRSKSVERNFTKAQVESVRRILSCKDLYGVLGLTKDASEEDIKKAYKNLARKFHPDKNHAPGATEAFKKIGSASAVLLDPTKRARYDQFGTVGDVPRSVTRQRNGDGVYYQFDGHHGFDAEMFNMFFNTGFPFSQNLRPQARTRTNRGNENENNYFAYVQLLPLLILFGLSFFSNLFVKDPYFSLSRTSKYPVERITTTHNLPYYVKQSFMTDYDGSLKNLEAQVIEQHVYYLRDRCFKERSHKEALQFQARYTHNAELYERAKSYATPSCDRVVQLYG